MPTGLGGARHGTFTLSLVLRAVLLGVMLLRSAPLSAQPGRAATGTIRTDTLWAQALGLKKSLVVYLPPSYATEPRRRYPVLLYLHGLTGNERNWVEQGRLARTMDSLVAAGAPEAILVMPDGDDSWYTTFAALPDLAGCQADTVRKEAAASFCVPWPHYDDYIAFDVLQHVDTHYRTRADRAHRGIAGLSMGGYGAISLALAYPELFRAAASHSGVLSPRLLRDSAAVTGDGRYATPATFARAAGGLWASQRMAFGLDSIGWLTRDPAFLAARAMARARAGGPPMPALAIDVGRDDPWIAHNRDAHAALDRLGVVHQYAEWPGGHTWDYWRRHSVESLTFLLQQVGTP